MYLCGQDPLHEWAFARVRRYELEREPLFVAPPEYVIVRKLEFYREGGSEKHRRDIRSMLDASPELIGRTVLEKLIIERGLAEPWRKAQAHRG